MTDIQIANFADGGSQLERASRPVTFNSKTGQVRIASGRGLELNSVLLHDEWEAYDRAVIESAKVPLVAVADLKSRGLVDSYNSIGVQVATWNVESDMGPAAVSMSGRGTRDYGIADYDLRGVPIPVIWKAVQLDARTLEARRRLGATTDVTNVMLAARKVYEKQEDMLINGDSSIKFDGQTIYGYTTHPDRITDTAAGFGGGPWTDILNIVPTIAGMISSANNANRYGPFTIYAAPAQYNAAALNFYDDGTGDTPLARINRMGGVESFKLLPHLDDGNLIMVQLDRETVDWISIWDARFVEWTTNDLMTANFRVMAICAPRIRSDYNGSIGLVHATGA